MGNQNQDQRDRDAQQRQADADSQRGGIDQQAARQQGDAITPNRENQTRQQEADIPAESNRMKGGSFDTGTGNRKRSSVESDDEDAVDPGEDSLIEGDEETKSDV